MDREIAEREAREWCAKWLTGIRYPHGPAQDSIATLLQRVAREENERVCGLVRAHPGPYSAEPFCVSIGTLELSSHYDMARAERKRDAIRSSLRAEGGGR